MVVEAIRQSTVNESMLSWADIAAIIDIPYPPHLSVRDP